MTHTLSAFPLEATSQETACGFRLMVLSLGDFVGIYPGERVEVLARRLSTSDVLIKSKGYRKSEAVILYLHLRFGYPTRREQVRIALGHMRSGFWRWWFRGYWPWRTDWQQVPHGHYQNPTDDCSKTLSFSRIIGVPFHDDIHRSTRALEPGFISGN